MAACLAGLEAASTLGVASADTRPTIESIQSELRTRSSREGRLPRSDADDDVDASMLWCGPLLRVFGPFDPFWRATFESIEARLLDGHGGVHRFRVDTFYGGGEWPVLTASLGLGYLARDCVGDVDRARRCLAWIDEQRAVDGGVAEQASCHPLHPDEVAGWVDRWGPVATPLTWSHAMALLLRRGLGATGLARHRVTVSGV